MLRRLRGGSSNISHLLFLKTGKHWIMQDLSAKPFVLYTVVFWSGLGVELKSMHPFLAPLPYL